MNVHFKLTQKAKSKGADKYTSVDDSTFSVYIPQNLSRSNDVPFDNLSIVFSNVTIENSIEFNLIQKAKNKGGDKYVCTIDEAFNLYISQNISRMNSKEPIHQLYIVVNCSQ